MHVERYANAHIRLRVNPCFFHPLSSTALGTGAGPQSFLPPRRKTMASSHPSPQKTTKGSTFWLSFTAAVVCNFLGALDLTAVSTALPTITKELDGNENFVWVGAAYALASAAILPFTGRLADILGRRPVMLSCIAFLALGSALSGSAKSMNWLIAARSTYTTKSRL